ncbi:MAG: phosphatidylserine decarboxylase, partial [Gracilibacteraceae bacterium]|nr:phosphatidylserine decarboxylase [Gracilibacteraceae bacterium]
TARFGRIVWAEVGAMLVGRIIQTHTGAPARKGDEKGYFEFGGSSIVLLLKQDAAIIDPDILAHSAQGIETKVTRGEKIGESHV